MELKEKLTKVGISLPEIMLPGKDADPQKWAVIACDQFSSEPAYWEGVSDFVGDAPSTLNLIYPECYLEDGDGEERIKNINTAMKSYLDQNILRSKGSSFILTRRTTPDSPERWGLMTALDLEAYDFTPGSKSLIRATEGTILDRIPPRKEIRKDALLEFPHIMVLLNDPDGLCIEPFRNKPESLEKVYDFELMMGSGHLTGYHISAENEIEAIADGLLQLLEKENPDDPMLYAMGDGNHSLATAKSIWEDVKTGLSEEEKINHPARFALVELVNLFDTGIVFEPIHRILFNTDPEKSLNALLSSCGGEFTAEEDLEKISSAVTADPAGPVIGILGKKVNGYINLTPEEGLLPTGVVQDWMDAYLLKQSESRVDYIHGTDSTRTLAAEERNMGILLPAIDKSSFFDAVKSRGAFPRKTFSMGEAREKRFYMESRKIQ